ncbi:AAA family ATPase [Embleya sp. NPDC050493]|uniref:AAA family ATPase n=1 Tax=Embleya sp. NPDC050493 TaxID=3363989 RepID=UPI0037BAAF17
MLHGGNDELAAVTALLQRTRAGDGGAIVLRGAAGAGKTTLLGEAMWQAKGMTVLRTAGPRGGGALPYTALRQLLAGLHPRIGRLPHTRAQALRTALGLAPGAADRGVVAAAACSLVLIAAREQPVLILVDDAHWLDAASAAVVAYIARRAEGVPIAVLRATREGAGADANSAAAKPAGDAGARVASDAGAAEAPASAGAAGEGAGERIAGSTGASGTAGIAGTAGEGTIGAMVGSAADSSAIGGSGVEPGAAERAASDRRVGDSSAMGGAASAGRPSGPDTGADTGTVTGIDADTATATINDTDTDRTTHATEPVTSHPASDTRRGRPEAGPADAVFPVADGAERATAAAGDGVGAAGRRLPEGVAPFDAVAAARPATETSRGAAGAGGRRPGSGAAVAGGDVPFAALPEDARRLLALAALEPAADLDQLAVAGRRIGIGRSARLAVLRAGLVDAAEHRVRFRNAAAREEVRRSLTPAERRSLHGALVYAASGALAYRRPWHLAALATGPDADLAAALEAGAGRTRRELGAGAAAATWEQAARLTSDAPVARRRYVAAAYAAWEAGFPARARTLLDTADATDLPGVVDEGASAHSSGTAIRLRAALRHAEGHRSEAGALLLEAAHGRAALLLAATGAAWEAGDRARTTQARAALSALPLADDDPLRTVVAALGADGVSPAMVAPATRARLYGLGIALWEVTPLAVHAAATDQAAYEVLLDEAAVLRTHGARGALAAALMPLAVAGALSGRAVEAETHAAEGLRLARSTGQGTLAAWFLAALSMAATTQGRIAEARDGAWQALRLTGTKGLTPVGAYALYALAVVERAEGRTEAACELLAKALAAPAGALMEVRIRAELATAGPNRSGVAALPPRPTHPNTPPLALTGRITRTPQLATGSA